MEHQPKVFSSKSLESLGTVAFTQQILQDGTGQSEVMWGAGSLDPTSFAPC